MTYLIVGLVIWSGIHFIPALAPGAKEAVIEKIGRTPYRGLFSLVVLTSLGLMIFGWGEAGVVDLYDPPPWGYTLNNLLMGIAIFLMTSTDLKTRLRLVIRHPMLTGVIVWAAAHLLANGDLRSVILFAGVGLWAAVEILLINRREGPWVKPEPKGVIWDVASVFVAAIVYFGIAWLHGYLGAPPLVF